MDVDDRKQVAKEAGYVLLSEDDGQEIYGRDDLPSTVEFDGTEWTLHLRDFNLDPVGHQHLGDAATTPSHRLRSAHGTGPRPTQRLDALVSCVGVSFSMW